MTAVTESEQIAKAFLLAYPPKQEDQEDQEDRDKQGVVAKEKDINDLDAEIILISTLLNSCMVKFLIDELTNQVSQKDITVLSTKILNIIEMVSPKKYLEPKLRTKSFSEGYVFFAILSVALKEFAMSFPDHERNREINLLRKLVRILLVLKYFQSPQKA